jgi:hypothetical protein
MVPLETPVTVRTYLLSLVITSYHPYSTYLASALSAYFHSYVPLLVCICPCLILSSDLRPEVEQQNGGHFDLHTQLFSFHQTPRMATKAKHSTAQLRVQCYFS